MSQSACLLRSFTHPSYQGSTGDVARALGDSITFGRFLSEPLAWEKWSTFTNNCYLEEAEKFSKQGSVSQMKAYFEAHYKRIRAKKAAEAAAAAALLEEAKAAANEASHPQVTEDSRDKQALVPGVNLESNPVVVEEARPVMQDAAIDERDIQEVADHEILDWKKSKEEAAPVASSSQSSDYKRASKLSSYSKPPSPIPQNKEAHATLNCKRNKETNAITNSMKMGVREFEDRKKSTQMSVNCASAGETTRNSPRLQKIRSSTMLPPVVEIPTRDPKIEIPKRSWINSPSENKSRVNSTGGGQKSWSPTVCSPFNFRTEQRVAKRKEFFEKLEEKSRMEAEKAFQRKPKVKAETDSMKQRWSSASTLKLPTDSHYITGQPVDHVKKEKAENDPMKQRWSSASTLKSPIDSYYITGQSVNHIKKGKVENDPMKRGSNVSTLNLPTDYHYIPGQSVDHMKKEKPETDPMNQLSSALTLKSPTDSHYITRQPVDHIKKVSTLKAQTDSHHQLRWSSASILRSPTTSHYITGQLVDHMKIQPTRTRSPELERKSNSITVENSNAQPCNKSLGKAHGYKLAQGTLNTSPSGSLLKNRNLQENASPNIRW